MVISVIVPAIEMDMDPRDFYERRLQHPFSQVRATLEKYPNEPITIELLMNGAG